MQISYISLTGKINSFKAELNSSLQELVGRKWDSSLLEDGTSLLMRDLPLSYSAPGGMVEYRRTLALRLVLVLILFVVLVATLT